MKGLYSFFRFYTFKNLIISYTFILFDVFFILYQLSFPCEEAFINSNNASYVLHLYGFIIIQLLYIIIKYLSKFNLYMFMRLESLQKFYSELYATILMIIITFTILYNLTLFFWLNIFQRQIIISDVFYLINTIVLQILFYSVFAQLYLWFYLISFKIKTSLFSVMISYYIIAFLVPNFGNYSLVCSTLKNRQYYYNLIYVNFILFILTTLRKRRDVNIEA